MSTLTELADLIQVVAKELTLPSQYHELNRVAAEMRSLEAQPVNVQMLEALREIVAFNSERFSDGPILKRCRAAIAAAQSAPVPAVKKMPRQRNDVDASKFCLTCGLEFDTDNPVCCDEGTTLDGSINGVCAKCCDGKLHGGFKAAPVPESAEVPDWIVAIVNDTRFMNRTPTEQHCMDELVKLARNSGAAQKAEEA